MSSVPCRLLCLNSWYPAGSDILGGNGRVCFVGDGPLKGNLWFPTESFASWSGHQEKQQTNAMTHPHTMPCLLPELHHRSPMGSVQRQIYGYRDFVPEMREGLASLWSSRGTETCIRQGAHCLLLAPIPTHICSSFIPFSGFPASSLKPFPSSPSFNPTSFHLHQLLQSSLCPQNACLSL